MATMGSAATATGVEDQAGGADPSAVPSPHGDTGTGAGSPPPADSEAAESEEAAAISLLGDEKYQSVKDDPKKLAKALHQSYTQRMQRASQHDDFIRSWTDDPEGTIERMASQFGMKVERGRGAAPVEDQVRAELANVFGEEAADRLVSTLTPLVERIVDAKTQPIKEDTEVLNQERALAKADALYERMDAKYGKEWRKFDPAMTQLGQKLLPRGMDDFEYMELLYDRVRAKAAVADKAEESLERVNRSVRGAEKPTQGVNPSRVANVPLSPGGKIRFEDAWAAAKAGKVLDPDEVRRAKRAAGK